MVSEDSTSRVIVLPVTARNSQYEFGGRMLRVRNVRVFTKICMLTVLLDPVLS